MKQSIIRTTSVFALWLTPLAVLVLWLVMAASLHAATPPPSEAGTIIQSTIERLRSAVRQEITPGNAADPTHVSALVDQIVLPQVDLGLSGRLILGRHWRAASAAERRDFIAGYRALLLRVYAAHAADYMDAEVQILNNTVSAAEGSPSRPNLTVRTRVTRPGKPVASVDYRMVGVDGTWKIFDAVVNGVSIVSVLRIAVNEEIARYGLSGFNATLIRRPR